MTVLACAGRASADGTSDEAAAEALFEDAKTLMRQGKYAEACPKLAESQRLDAGPGTLLALGLCYEKDAKTASAWATFRSAAAAARQARQADRERIAEEHAKALEPKLAYLTVVVPPADRELSSLAVARDDVALTSASFGVSVPVNPGEHVVRATAEGKKSAVLRVTVAEASRISVDVPVLEDDPRAAAKIARTNEVTEKNGALSEKAAPAERRSRVPAYVAYGVGAVGLGIGAVFGLQAMGSSKDAKDLCSTAACSDRDAATSKHDSAVTQAWISNVGFAVGAVGVVAGTVLLLTTRGGSSESRVSASVGVAPGGGPSAGLSGVF